MEVVPMPWIGGVRWCQFSAAVFTNLTQDHLDHHSMQAYFEAKAACSEPL